MDDLLDLFFPSVPVPAGTSCSALPLRYVKRLSVSVQEVSGQRLFPG